MKSLFINTSTKKTIVATVVDEEIKYSYRKDNNGDLSDNLMTIIDEVFTKSNMTPNDIDTIFVTTGPGSFTGIRIGLTVIKVMAWGLKKKVIPISSLELMASTKTDKKYIAPLIDGRNGYAFAGLYDNNLNQVIADEHLLLNDFKEKVDDKEVYYVSDDNFEFEVNESDYDILRIMDKHKNDEGINPHKLNPNYLKKSSAEEKIDESRR